jgi:protein-tyrosine phosphatase
MALPTVTPHIHPGRYENDASSIAQSLAGFRSAIEEAAIPLQLGFAGEVRLGPEIISMVESVEIPFFGEVNDEKVFLLEIPHSHVPTGSDKLIQCGCWTERYAIKHILLRDARSVKPPANEIAR